MDHSARCGSPEEFHKHVSRFSLVPMLEKHLAEYDRPFSWERHCITFCGSWVRMVTGIDPLEGLPPCDTAMSAGRTLNSMGFPSVIEAISSVLPERPVTMVRVGDIVAREVCGEMAVGIVAGTKAAFLGRVHLEFLLASAAVCAWSVG